MSWYRVLKQIGGKNVYFAGRVYVPGIGYVDRWTADAVEAQRLSEQSAIATARKYHGNIEVSHAIR